ncbi:MAG: IS110 family transposase [Acidobacteria bacterium]|nr:MAG: IS110 family transposase [Acidobacteriota bacterium]
MTQETTRNAQNNISASTLFLAFELGTSEWKLGFSIGLGQKPRKRTIEAGNLERLQSEIAAAKKRFHLAETTPVLSCYEAGRDGFWLHRYLVKSGIENLVVDSSSIEVNRKKRRAKSDGLDADSLLRQLIRHHSGERKVWSVVQAPSPEEEDRRQLHRELRTLKKERTRTTNRIKGLLAGQGIRLKAPLDLSDVRLDAMRLWDGSGLRPGLKSWLKREWEHVLFLRGQIAVLRAERRRALRQSEEPDLDKVHQLSLLRGIGENGSWIFVREFFGWRKFNNRREVGSLAGLTPTPYQSGRMMREQGISKAGNRHVRAAAIELAWCWVRWQPKSKLTRWFEARFAKAGSRGRKVGIVAVARRLLIDLWKYLETGVLPEGAQLKAEV